MHVWAAFTNDDVTTRMENHDMRNTRMHMWMPLYELVQSLHDTKRTGLALAVEQSALAAIERGNPITPRMDFSRHAPVICKMVWMRRSETSYEIACFERTEMEGFRPARNG